MNKEVDSKSWQKVADYCQKHGYIDPFIQEGYWWAFPRYGVIPVQLPVQQQPTLQERVERLRLSIAGLIWFHGLILCGLLGILLIYKTIAIAPSPFAIITGLFIALYGSYILLVINRFLLVFFDIRLSDRFVVNVFSGFSIFLCLFIGLTMFGFNLAGAFTAVVLLAFTARLFSLTD
ncbi:MAG: hypothetical protein AAFQ89_15595 [Cyanobacteria bacterium J06626_18]